MLTGAARLLARLPLGVLYVLSDAISLLMMHVVRYRRKVIKGNLRKAFPNKKSRERRAIRRAYYRHLSDVLMETLKLLTISEEEINRRVRISGRGRAMLTDNYHKGITTMCLLGHYGNWEWITAGFYFTHPIKMVPAYRPLHNPVIDRFMLDVRMRFAHQLIPKKQVARSILRFQKEGPAVAIGLVADQMPRNQESYSTVFLGQETLVYSGPEKLARMMNMPVYFLSVTKLRRGYYEITAEPISDSPKEETEGMISQRFMDRLEQEILKAPEIWLWSHRRWKVSNRRTLGDLGQLK